MERRQAQKRLQRKTKKDAEEEKKQTETRKESSKTFASWQVITAVILVYKAVFNKIHML